MQALRPADRTYQRPSRCHHHAGNVDLSQQFLQIPRSQLAVVRRFINRSRGRKHTVCSTSWVYYHQARQQSIVFIHHTPETHFRLCRRLQQDCVWIQAQIITRARLGRQCHPAVAVNELAKINLRTWRRSTWVRSLSLFLTSFLLSDEKKTAVVQDHPEQE